MVDETLMQILKMDAKLSAIADKLQGLEDSSVATEHLSCDLTCGIV